MKCSREISRPRPWPWSKWMAIFKACRSMAISDFRFVEIGPFALEIQQIQYLTLRIQGQGHGRNRLESSQASHRSGPSILVSI